MSISPEAGRYYKLKVLKRVDFGLYLDGGEKGELLLPKRFVPAGVKIGEDIEVFVYHDSENRLIATTQQPHITIGEIGYLKILSTTAQGAFADWGLMKDLFIPLSQQRSRMVQGGQYFVGLYLDEQTGRVAGTERIEGWLSNETMSIEEWQPVHLLVWRATDLGFKCILNSRHTGLLHHGDIFRDLNVGDAATGYVKRILPENKLDLTLQAKGYGRVSDDSERILQRLRDNGGYLPYNDKTPAEEIYAMLGMSKKTFKMVIGGLYKEAKIQLTKGGIQLVDGENVEM